MFNASLDTMPFNNRSPATATAKGFCLTADFLDELRRAKRHYTPDHLDAMMRYAAALGASRFEWIAATAWALYDSECPCGYDLLATARQSAHRHGLRFDVVYKPFEGANTQPTVVMPHAAPRPAGAVLLDDPMGLVHAVRPFVAAHPELRMRRHPDADRDPGGPIAAIRLVNRSEAPLPCNATDLSLWTSPRNGGFVRYTGPVIARERLAWRLGFPYRDAPCCMVELGELHLPSDTRYVRVCNADAFAGATLRNAIGAIVELVNADGQPIPCMTSQTPVDANALHQRMCTAAELGATRYLRHPDVRAFLSDRTRFLAACEGMMKFGASACGRNAAFGPGDTLVACRDIPRHHVSALNPVEPAVREHWLAEIQGFIDKGADGVNLRLTHHNPAFEPEAYGFNEATLTRCAHSGNLAEARRVNGEAYDTFLAAARALLNRQGRELGLHVHAEHFSRSDRGKRNLGLNIEMDWARQVRQFADYVEFRGSDMLQPATLAELLDRIGLVAREAGIPLIYQSLRHMDQVHFNGPHPCLAWDLEMARRHPDVQFYNLYETAHFGRLNDRDDWEGSPDITDLVRRHWTLPEG